MDQQKLLQKFEFKEILSKNQTQKRIVVLGNIKDEQGEAILIIGATTPCPPPLVFQKISTIFHNDIYSRYDTLVLNNYEIQSIYPITQKHKDKYRAKKMRLIEETAEEYQQGKEQLLNKELSHIGWVENICEGKAEVERVLFKCQDFILLPDFKYSDLSKTQNLHILCIFTGTGLYSLRDLRGQHVELLRKVEQEIEKVMIQRFSMSKGEYRMYFHYPPTFYRMHLHITSLTLQSFSALVDRAHLLQQVINNLSICPDYYSRVGLMKQVEIK